MLVIEPKEPNPWVDAKTYPQVLKKTAEQFPENDAVVFPQLGIRWSYSEFYQKVRKTARALLALRIQPEAHIGIWCTNWPQWVLVQFAAAEFGAVVVNINPAYQTHELAYILKQADLDTLIITDTFKNSDYEKIVAELIPEVNKPHEGYELSNSEFPLLCNVITIKSKTRFPGIWTWDDFINEAENIDDWYVDELGHKLVPYDPINIQFTSGTTGSPKGTMLSHRNLLLNAFYAGERMRITDQDRICIPVPFYHCFGCVFGTLLCVIHGAAMVIPAESFDPEATLQAIEAEKCTALYGVPTMFSAEIHSPDFPKFIYDSLRTGIMAGSPCPIELMKQVLNKMNLREMTIAYGLTEASPGITMTSPDDPVEVRVSTVGKELPGVEVRIVNPETGEDMPEGQQGELWARGHNIMIGYYKQNEATKAAVSPEGWLRTGDLATRTPDGHYRITGRSKDVIIRGGENIYPREIEEFLLSHPKIREVQVLGLPDEHYGEQISAWIVPADDSLTTEEVKSFCKGSIAHYKIPYYIDIITEYPLTVTGKVQKYRLRELGIEQYKLQGAANIETI